mmetsp:Transcript_9808/g.19987  ORF Transcript_9808/g.19987 Transcript_9808/m.19987 type:complete len:90 (-) Transcript_9808:692-961(-)
MGNRCREQTATNYFWQGREISTGKLRSEARQPLPSENTKCRKIGSGSEPTLRVCFKPRNAIEFWIRFGEIITSASCIGRRTNPQCLILL